MWTETNAKSVRGYNRLKNKVHTLTTKMTWTRNTQPESERKSLLNLLLAESVNTETGRDTSEAAVLATGVCNH